jgi:hypothetical protein
MVVISGVLNVTGQIGAANGEADAGSADRESFDGSPEELDVSTIPGRWQACGSQGFDGNSFVWPLKNAQ